VVGSTAWYMTFSARGAQRRTGTVSLQLFPWRVPCYFYFLDRLFHSMHSIFFILYLPPLSYLYLGRPMCICMWQSKPAFFRGHIAFPNRKYLEAGTGTYHLPDLSITAACREGSWTTACSSRWEAQPMFPPKSITDIASSLFCLIVEWISRRVKPIGEQW